MAHIFLCDDVQKLLNNKFVVVLGSSVQRAVYKDLVILLQKNKYLTDKQLRNKGELKFENDELIAGGIKGGLNNGVNFREVREYKTDHHWIKYYFITRCYNAYIETILKELAKEPQPDVLILNSCLWDVTRYGHGAASIVEFKQNMIKLCTRLKEILPASCTVLWNSAMPVSKDAKGGVLVPEADFLKSTVSMEILEANYLTCSKVAEFGFDVIDVHFHLQNQIHRRAEDGVHWDMTAHRRISNLILTHLSEAWNVPLPCNIKQLFTQSVLSPTGKLSPTKKLFATKQVSPVQNKSGKVLQAKNISPQKKSPGAGRGGKTKGNRKRKHNIPNLPHCWQGPKHKAMHPCNTPNLPACPNRELFHQEQMHTNINPPRIAFSRVNSMLERSVNFLRNMQDSELGIDNSHGGHQRDEFEAMYGGPVRRTNYFADEWQPYQDRNYTPSQPANRVHPRFTPYSPFY